MSPTSDSEPELIDDEFMFDEADIYTQVDVSAREIRLSVGSFRGAGAAAFTPGQARTFALALMRMADQAEGRG
jgi:hypothetical protein